jgi:hypothetical protein
MSLTRRRFIEAASLTLLAGAARPAVFAQTASSSKGGTFEEKNLAVLEDASEETFKPFVGERFTVTQGKQQFEPLTLKSVTKAEQSSSATKAMLSSKPAAAGSAASGSAKETTTGFALRFRGSGKPLSQGTYVLENHGLGSFALFIVPGGPKMNPNTYTATFNRLVK